MSSGSSQTWWNPECGRIPTGGIRKSESGINEGGASEHGE